MAKQSITQLKNWFVTQAKPLQAQFWDWFDSYRHKDEKIAVDDLAPELKSLVQSIPDYNVINQAIAAKSDVLTQDVTANVTVGNVPSDTVFPKGMTLTEYIQKVHTSNSTNTTFPFTFPVKLS